MKFTTPLNLWAPGVQDAILNGTLRVQRGQWVRCGDGKLSRFVRSTGRSLWVAHWQGSGAATRERFMTLVAASK
jgi:hypothetical protein